MTDPNQGPRLVVSLAELRQLRRGERAPRALHQSVSQRLERAIISGPHAPGERSAVAAQDSRSVASEPESPAALRLTRPGAGRATWRPEPRSMALGFVAASLLFALTQLRRGAAPAGSFAGELTLAPEPAEPTGSQASAGAGRSPSPATPESTLGSTSDLPRAPGEVEAANVAARRSSRSSLAEAFVKKLEAEPPPEPSTLGDPSPETQPGLLRDLPARSIVVPGFAATLQATVREMPLPPALGPNLVTNGDFSHGTALWSVRRWDSFGVGPTPTARTPFGIVDGALCTTIRSGDLALGGWPWEDRSLSPSSFELERGQRYRLSLRAWTKGPLPVALVFKVAHQHEPYGPAVVATVPVTLVPHLFSVTFEPHADDDEAGIAFVASALATRQARLGSSDLCIDDVRVTREARPL